MNIERVLAENLLWLLGIIVDVLMNRGLTFVWFVSFASNCISLISYIWFVWLWPFYGWIQLYIYCNFRLRSAAPICAMTVNYQIRKYLDTQIQYKRIGHMCAACKLSPQRHNHLLIILIHIMAAAVSGNNRH